MRVKKLSHNYGTLLINTVENDYGTIYISVVVNQLV
jgi:hypothetical protein